MNADKLAEIVLVIGGARSGKSGWAQELARARGSDAVVFIATAEARDDEMRARIAQHRAERPPHWQTLEAPRNLTGAVAGLQQVPRLIIVDCLTLWVTNELLANGADLEKRMLCQLDLLVEWARLHDVDLILVTNEVGLGIVPENALAREFRDVVGRVNAHAAQLADKVYWMVAGLAVELKSIAVPRNFGKE